MSENQKEEKKGWSWLGLFFAPYYYAGYGELKKGIIYGILIVIPFIGIVTSIVIGILSGKNARKDLPIGKQKFKWANVAITFAVMAIVSIVLQIAVESFQKDVSNSAFSQEEYQETYTKVNISNILADYENNEVAADNKYKDKLIQTTGIISDIKKDLLDNLYVSLGTGAMFEIPGFQAFFDDSMASELGNLRKGSRLTVACRIEGLMVDVIAKECVLGNQISIQKTQSKRISNYSKPVFIESYEDGIITVLLKGNESYCTIKLTDKEVVENESEIISTNCIRDKNKKTLCTKNNEICKTENQISDEIDKEFGNVRQGMQQLQEEMM
jgi:hypothetical protein